jgi:hypothetical protein
MCPPIIAGVMIVVAAAQMAMSIQQQQTAQKAQIRANQLARAAAITTMNNKNVQVAQQQGQERDSAVAVVNANNIKANEAKSTAQAAVGSAGISGVSVDSLMSNLSAGQGRYNASVAEDLRTKVAGHDWDRLNNYNEMAGKVNTLKRPDAVDYAGESLKLVGSVASTLSSAQGGNQKAPQGTTNTSNKFDTNNGTQLSIDQVNTRSY